MASKQQQTSVFFYFCQIPATRSDPFEIKIGTQSVYKSTADTPENLQGIEVTLEAPAGSVLLNFTVSNAFRNYKKQAVFNLTEGGNKIYIEPTDDSFVIQQKKETVIVTQPAQDAAPVHIAESNLKKAFLLQYQLKSGKIDADQIENKGMLNLASAVATAVNK